MPELIPTMSDLKASQEPVIKPITGLSTDKKLDERVS